MAKKRKVVKSEDTLKTPSDIVTVGMEEDEDEKELSKADDAIISASEDESGSDDERKHRKLLDAISSLGGKKRRKLAERSEASAQISEFSVSAEGAGAKLTLGDLLGTLEKTAVVTKTKKQLKNLQNRRDTLELPLSRKQTEKIQREVAYGKSTEEISAWQGIVQRNRKAEQLVFPLNQERSEPKRVEQVVAGWKAQTPLEQEIFSLLHMNKQPIHNPVLTPIEEASLKAMSLDEAKIRRAELQKARALQSYYESKAKRDKKIKSKKYHKVQNKAKRKEFLKEFEKMREADPEAALEELEKMELGRMQERMSLKHQNSGKWAKSRVIMGKYDLEARKAMQQQLAMNKELTKKLAIPSEGRDEEGCGAGPEEMAAVLPDFVNEVQAVDAANPWMMGKLTAEAPEPAVGSDANPPAEGVQQQENPEDGTDEEEVIEEEEALLREFEERRKSRQSEDGDGDLVPVLTMESEVNVKDESGVGEIPDDDEEEEDEQEVSEFNSLFQKLGEKEEQEAAADAGTTSVETPDREEPALLEEGLTRFRTLEDMDLLSQDLPVESDETAVMNPDTPRPEETTTPQTGKRKRNKDLIDCNKVLTKEAKVIQIPQAPTAVEEEEEKEVEQKMIIKEAFAGDDVVSDFLKEKRKQEEAGRPKVVDLTLPGWGEWGGLGLKPSRSKRRRFRIKAEPPPLRRDKNLPNVIISEKRISSITMHQVSQLPFPFTSPEQFESRMRTPIGSSWNTQRTVQKLTAPKVVTKKGAIIEPITKEDFIRGKTLAATGRQPDISLSAGRGPNRGPQKKGPQKKGPQKKGPQKKGHPKSSQQKAAKDKAK